VVAIFLKVLTLGGFYPGPIIGIAIQALSLEVAFTATGGTAVGAAVGGFLALATNPLQMVVTTWVVTGTDAVRTYLVLLHEAAAAIGLGWLRAEIVFAAVVVGKGCIGVVGGFWAWGVAGRVMRRLGRGP
jgi:hypothetical protein